MKDFFKNRFSISVHSVVWKFFSFKRVIIMILTSITVLFIKYMFNCYELIYNDVIDHPYLSFGTLFSIIMIKNIVKITFEEGIFPQHHTMDGPTGRSADSVQQGSTQQGNTQQGNNVNNIFHGDGFTIVNGVYHISDPTNVTANPFENPATGGRYPSYRPYSTYLVNAMTHEIQGGSPSQVMKPGKFQANEMRFFDEFMESTYPNRHPNQYFNSAPVRKALRELP